MIHRICPLKRNTALDGSPPLSILSGVPDPPVAQVGPDETNKVGRYLKEFMGLHYPMPGYGVERVDYIQPNSIPENHGPRRGLHTIYRVHRRAAPPVAILSFMPIGYPLRHVGHQMGGSYSFEKFAHLVQ